MTSESSAPGGVNGGDAADQVAVADAGEAGGADHLRERLLPGEPADALHQVAVGRGVARGEPAQPRDHLEGVEVVEAVEQRHLAGGELEAQEPSARPQDAK